CARRLQALSWKDGPDRDPPAADDRQRFSDLPSAYSRTPPRLPAIRRRRRSQYYRHVLDPGLFVNQEHAHPLQSGTPAGAVMATRPARSPLMVHLIKFNAVGALGFALQSGALFVFTHNAYHVNYLAATAAAVELAVLH